MSSFLAHADEKHSHSIMLPPPCFTVIMVLSGWKAVLGFRQEMDYITVSPCLYSSVTHVFILTVFIWLEATRQERPVRPLFLPFCLDFHKILRLNCLVEDQVALGQGDIRAISGLIPCWRGATKKKKKNSKIFLCINITYFNTTSSPSWKWKEFLGFPRPVHI